MADDVILNNVIGFDVKVWDPDYVDPVTGAKGGYVDLGYTRARLMTVFPTRMPRLGPTDNGGSINELPPMI